MLVAKDDQAGLYRIVVNNFSDSAELASDFSYLEQLSVGRSIIIDFTHMAAPLTQERRQQYLPGGFGHQPTLQLLEVVSATLAFAHYAAIRLHRLKIILPDPRTRVGRFLSSMHLPYLLKKEGLFVAIAGVSNPELGFDDATRQNLIPLKYIQSEPDYEAIMAIHNHVEQVFNKALHNDSTLAERFTSVVDEAVDNLITYGKGGLIGGLYYPQVGEVEITLVNREGGFGGNTPMEQLEALITAFEGDYSRASGGNGIRELSKLSTACFGTLLLRNGNASLLLSPDGSITSNTDELGLTVPGAYVSLLLQLLPDPSRSLPATEASAAFEPILRDALEQYLSEKGFQF